MRTQPNAVSAIVAEIRGLCNKVGVERTVRPGPEATYSTTLVITILIMKSLFGFDSESSFLRFLALHHGHVFPRLPERSWFNRKAKKLASVQQKIHAHLLGKLAVVGLSIEVVEPPRCPS